MNMIKKSALCASLLLSTTLKPFTAPSAQEVMSVDPITVEAPMISSPASAIYNISGDGIITVPYSDGADYLASLPGISAGRFGGHGLEPVIRGQSKNQLNVVSDNTYVFGACPSRMDPPTSYLTIQPQDEVTLVRGYQSVLNGFGGTGGSIIVKQKAPDFIGDVLTTMGSVNGGYDSNGQMWNSGGNVTSGNADAYANAYASYKDANNYEDGNSKEVRSAFTEYTAGMKVGYTPGDAHIYAGVDFHEIKDALFAGAGMDSPQSKNVIYKAGLETPLDGDVFKNVELSGYASLVDHTMDNFSLRQQTGMAMSVSPESNTFGARVKSDVALSNRIYTALAEWRRNVRTSAMPSITVDEITLAGETTFDLGLQDRLITGLRYDYIHAGYEDENDPQTAMAARTSNDVYQQFYGINASSKNEHHLGGLIRYEYDYSLDTLVYAGISRSIRAADVIERGLANFMGMSGMMSWVGNPDIESEKHHQLDIGFDTQKSTWSLSGSAYANIVEDYILRDSARDLGLPNADIYRNVDAFLGGFEVMGEWGFVPDWTLFGDATYTYGQDLDAGRALPQIPALQGRVGLDWQAMQDLSLRSTMRWATQQNRVDTDSATGTGRDVGKTNGYAVLDLEGTLQNIGPASLDFGVTNVLDNTYANHLNLSNGFDATEVQVNEPGRSFYLQMRVPF